MIIMVGLDADPVQTVNLMRMTMNMNRAIVADFIPVPFPETGRTLDSIIQDLGLGVAPPLPPAAPSDGSPTLTKEHHAILTVLAESPHAVMLQVDIAAAVQRSVGATRARLTELREHGLVHRPLGERKGEAITPQGICCCTASSARR